MGHLMMIGLFIGYLVVVVGLVTAVLMLPKHLWKERWPMNFKLRRMAGEGALKKVMELDEAFLPVFLGAVFPPFLLALIPLLAFNLVPKEYHGLMLGLAALLLVVSMAVRLPVLVDHARKWQNHRLGYFGERAVGEALVPLEKEGYHVFHDVPANEGKAQFNLDHVIVGPTGIVVVETKARRKKRGRPGYEEQKVTFDGQRLDFPWGEETRPVEQTVTNVTWLKGWLKQRTGKELPVVGILTLPGWFVTEKKLGAVRVVNPKFLPSTIKGWNTSALSAEDVDLVARQLLSVCQDVEPW